MCDLEESRLFERLMSSCRVLCINYLFKLYDEIDNFHSDVAIVQESTRE